MATRAKFALSNAGQTSDGPPSVPDGPPHFLAGMYADLTVE